MSRLFIAEKPSLGKAIAAQLPGLKKPARTHIVCGLDTVTWAFGHLFELAEPDHYLPSDTPTNGKGRKKWRLEDLPVLPAEWRKIPKALAKDQLAAIKSLLKEADEVVNAGDPDREGQLLVDEILEALRWRGPTKRIWLAALDPASVQKALAALKDNTAYRPLRDAAEARGRADWLVGMNLTRAYTLKSTSAGVVSVGRVQTPTLGLVVRRDAEIEAFVPISFYVPVTQCHHSNGDFKATWKAPTDPVQGTAYAPPLDPDGRLIDLLAAQRIINDVAGKTGKVLSFDSTDGQDPAPLPYTLSKLQAAASAKHGLSAQATLNAAQGLYETHKLASYPRTDCGYLPESQHSEAGAVMAAIAIVNPAFQSLTQGATLNRKSPAWNDKKITAHHGIIPTSHNRVQMSECSEAEQQVYELIVRAYVAQFYMAHAYTKTAAVVECGGHQWATKGRIVTVVGWRSVMTTQEQEKDEDAPALPLMRTGDFVDFVSGTVDKRVTKPKPRYTDGTLIADMGSVHKYVTDPKIKAKLKETSGLGTEATRANILETLLKREFIERQGKQVVSTLRGRALIAALPIVLSDPGITGLWEDALAEVAAGTRTLMEFETQQRAFVVKRIEAAKAGERLAMPASTVAPARTKPPAKRRSRIRATKSGTGAKLGSEKK